MATTSGTGLSAVSPFGTNSRTGASPWAVASVSQKSPARHGPVAGADGQLDAGVGRHGQRDVVTGAEFDEERPGGGVDQPGRRADQQRLGPAPLRGHRVEAEQAEAGLIEDGGGLGTAAGEE